MNQGLKHSIFIRKESLKFSAAHFTFFPDGSKEPLHGHNYQVGLRVELLDVSFQKMVAFSTFKKALRKLCETWDERVLLPEKNPFFKMKSNGNREIEFLASERRYLLPREEVVLLPIDNIAAESLAAEALHLVLADLEKAGALQFIAAIEIQVEETPGQGACCRWERK